MYNLPGIVLNRHFLSFLSQDKCLLMVKDISKWCIIFLAIDKNSP